MPLEHSLIQVVGITNSGAYLEAASNVIPFSAPSHGAFVRSSPSPVYFTVATLMEKIVGPLSAGSLRLASTDVKVNPIVRFNYFRNPGDVERYVGPSLPADLSNDFLMGEFCRRTVTTIWHYHEGCLVGKVVDRNFRVFGVDALKPPLRMQRTPAPYFMNGQSEMPRKRFAYESPIEELDYDRSVVPMEKPLGKSC
ncbi:hypothetical protein M9H77_00142 [Catharanthus roseus]|nr:hypothetical protein M9H77_00531 [Catharanthus roseus]KAI5640981.1 hypothetical protein M9H77_00142 [Catharanthus roseus]